MDDLDNMDLGESAEADGPQILLEMWNSQLEMASCSEVLQFVRSLEEIRGDSTANQLFNAVIAALREIKATGADLTAGDVKTVPEARRALIQLIAARDVPIRKWIAYQDRAVDQDITARKVANSAVGTFGHDAGAQSGAVHSTAAWHDFCRAGSSVMPSKQPPPLVRTKGLPKDASVNLPDDIIKKWQAEKVEDPCNTIECLVGLTTVLNVLRRC